MKYVLENLYVFKELNIMVINRLNNMVEEKSIKDVLNELHNLKVPKRITVTIRLEEKPYFRLKKMLEESHEVTISDFLNLSIKNVLKDIDNSPPKKQVDKK